MWRILKWLGWVAVVIAIVFLIAPAFGPRCIFPSTDIALGWLVRALQDYKTEHGHYPDVVQNGFIETESDNIKLIRILGGENPKQISFLTISENEVSATGAFIDRWGNFYRIRIDTDNDGIIENPYTDEPRQIKAQAIAWSLGKDGIQGHSKKFAKLKGSDDIVSWK